MEYLAAKTTAVCGKIAIVAGLSKLALFGELLKPIGKAIITVLGPARAMEIEMKRSNPRGLLLGFRKVILHGFERLLAVHDDMEDALHRLDVKMLAAHVRRDKSDAQINKLIASNDNRGGRGIVRGSSARGCGGFLFLSSRLGNFMARLHTMV
jgi:hypothetical protein